MLLPRPRGALRASGASLCLVLAASALPAGAGGQAAPAVAPEVPATTTDLTLSTADNSPMLVADPTEPRFVVLAHRVDAPAFGCGLQVSGDGGRSWVGANPVPRLPDGADVCYAPEVAFDRRGTLYYLFIGLAGDGNNPMGVFLTTSADRAQTFGAPRLLLGPSNYQVRMAVDPGVGDRGRLHLVWLRAADDSLLGGLPPEHNPLLAAYSDDGGRTFSEPVQVSDPFRPRSVAPAVAVGRDSAVHVAYFDLQDDVRDYQGLEGPAWDGTWSVVVASSYDRGRTWQRGVLVDGAVAPPGRVMLIYTMAPPSVVADRSGAVHVAWSDARDGDPDVLWARSADGGRSWSAPVRVNDDGRGNGRDQSLPRLGLAPTGRLDMVFLDRRDDPANVEYDVYYSWSVDGGPPAPNVRLTRRRSNALIGQRYEVPSAAGLVELGARLGLLSAPSYAVAAWPDTRNGLVGDTEQDVFTAAVTFPGGAPGGTAPAAPGRSGPPVPAALIVAGVLVLATGTAVALRRRAKRPPVALQ